MVWRPAAITFSALLLSMLAGCDQGETRAQPEEAAEPAEQPGVVYEGWGPARAMEQGGEASDSSPRTVMIEVGDGRMEFPERALPGPTRLFVRNGGNARHSLTVEGGGASESLIRPLRRSGQDRLDLELKPGRYELWCPLHEGEGERGSLVVEGEDDPGQ